MEHTGWRHCQVVTHPTPKAQEVIINIMRYIRWLALALMLLIPACQPAAPRSITILDGAKIHQLPADPLSPGDYFVRAGILLGPKDEALLNGIPVRLDEPLPGKGGEILQLIRANNLTLVTPEGSISLQTTASTVGQALQEAGLSLFTADLIDPPPETPVTGSMTVNYKPSRLIEIHTSAGSVKVRSAAATIGGALADAGLPLSGMDFSRPALTDPLPGDGSIQVVRVSESLVLAQKLIPFESEFQASADVSLDEQQVLHPGQAGLSVNRIRIRYEDGQEASRQTESESLVHPPENRVVLFGTRAEVKSATVDGVQIEYWRAVQMYATAYSPCRSGTDRCYSSTASGKPVKKGVVALRTDLYLGMRGQGLFIPGYGFATVEDACGGCVGKPWIDLGYSDNDYQQWGSWVTVYFLAPIPANITFVLE